MSSPELEPTRTIDEVLDALDGVVADARARRSRLGYFAAIYRKVTAKVKEGIAEGFFDDGPRMARLDVIFANRYLEALDQHRAGTRPTRSWRVAFDAADSRRPLVLQHLLVGINAHINLDLGIAAAATAPGDDLPSLRRDFDRINEILGSLVRQIKDEIGEISPWIGLLDRVGGSTDEEFVRFSMEVARTTAWRFAVDLAPLPADQWPGPVRSRDTRIAQLADRVLHPGFGLGNLLFAIRLRESGDVARNIDVLSRVPPPDLATVERRVQDARAGG